MRDLTRRPISASRAYRRDWVKDSIKRSLRRAHLDIHELGALGRSISSLAESVLQSGWSPSTIIDVGVASGTDELYRVFPRADLVLVEPVAEWESYLPKASADRNVTFITAAAWEEEATLDFSMPRDPLAASLLLDLGGDVGNTKHFTVNAAPLDSLLMKIPVAPPVALKIDVQGAELSVLRGASQLLQHTDLLIVETNLVRNYDQGALFDDVLRYVGDRGFRTIDIFGGTTNLTGAMLHQVDVGFVRQDSDLGRALLLRRF